MNAATLGPIAEKLVPMLLNRLAAMPDTDPKKGPLLDALLALLTNPAIIALIIKLLSGIG